jgi:hypothetical protein
MERAPDREVYGARFRGSGPVGQSRTHLRAILVRAPRRTRASYDGDADASRVGHLLSGHVAAGIRALIVSSARAL